MNDFNLKNPLELQEMLKDVNSNDLKSQKPVYEYIDKLHDLIKSYQVVIDIAINRNRNVK